MTNQQLHSKYIDHVQAQLAAGLPVLTIADWNEDRIRQEQAVKSFHCPKFSSVLKATVVFQIQAANEQLAFQEASRLLSQYEAKYCVEKSSTMNIPSPQQQLETAQAKIASIERAMQRRLDSMNKKIQQAEAALAALNDPK